MIGLGQVFLPFYQLFFLLIKSPSSFPLRGNIVLLVPLVPHVCISRVSIHHLSPKALSICPPPCWVPSLLLQTQQDERLLERCLLHKLHVHVPVLLKRVKSWKESMNTGDQGCRGCTNTHRRTHYLVLLFQTAALRGRWEAGTRILNRLCRSARIPEEAGKKLWIIHDLIIFNTLPALTRVTCRSWLLFELFGPIAVGWN